MHRIYLGLGSNQGDRRKNLAMAVEGLRLAGMADLRLSPLYETPALMPPDAPAKWNIPYLNMVVEGSFAGQPNELLSITQGIENRMGRVRLAKWAPRTLDIDILQFGNTVMVSDNLTLPHTEICHRAFVLDPFKDICPSSCLVNDTVPMLRRARGHPQHQPCLMAVVNVTPDSFSDGGHFVQEDDLLHYLEQVWQYVAYLDIGAESTRPRGQSVSEEEEWSRLSPVLTLIKKFLSDKNLPPRISVDTRHGRVAEKALEFGVDVINDVGGMRCSVMQQVIAASTCDYVLMHSLDIPVDPLHTLPTNQPCLPALFRWFEDKLADMDKSGIAADRVMLDPGLGFGKNPQQSWEIAQHISMLHPLGRKILVGHSRKSFLTHLYQSTPQDRDVDSIGVSLALMKSGVDVLRVHNPVVHHRAIQTFLHAQP